MPKASLTIKDYIPKICIKHIQFGNYLCIMAFNILTPSDLKELLNLFKAALAEKASIKKETKSFDHYFFQNFQKNIEHLKNKNE